RLHPPGLGTLREGAEVRQVVLAGGAGRGEEPQHQRPALAQVTAGQPAPVRGLGLEVRRGGAGLQSAQRRLARARADPPDQRIGEQQVEQHDRPQSELGGIPHIHERSLPAGVENSSSRSSKNTSVATPQPAATASTATTAGSVTAPACGAAAAPARHTATSTRLRHRCARRTVLPRPTQPQSVARPRRSTDAMAAAKPASRTAASTSPSGAVIRNPSNTGTSASATITATTTAGSAARGSNR